MYKRIFLLFFLNFYISFLVFPTNVNLTYDNCSNIFNIKIYDNSNKLSLNFTNSKINNLDLLCFEFNSLKINKSQLGENKELFVDKKSEYYLSFNYNNFKFITNFFPLNDSDYDIKNVILNKNNLLLDISFYKIKMENLSPYYIDYSSIKYTKKGILNYIEYKYNRYTLIQELAVSKFDILYSSKVIIDLSKTKITLNVKNLNEKLKYIINFNYYPIKVIIKESIYPKSIYSGQGTKRNFSIDSEYKINFNIFDINNKLKISYYHQIEYDEFLNKDIQNIFEVKNAIKYKSNVLEFKLNYDNKISLIIKYNKIKVEVNEKEAVFYVNYLSKQNRKEYLINISSKGILKIQYKINDL